MTFQTAIASTDTESYQTLKVAQHPIDPMSRHLELRHAGSLEVAAQTLNGVHVAIFRPHHRSIR